MTATREIVEYLDSLLETSVVPDYSNALNGIQLDNSGSVTKVAAAVDFSSRVVNDAVREKANLIVLHHGMFWSGLRPITAAYYSRLKMLIDNDIAVYSSHLPLDRHPQFGNNVLLSRVLGLVPSGEFAWTKGIAIGVRGEADIATSELLQKAKHSHVNMAAMLSRRAASMIDELDDGQCVRAPVHLPKQFRKQRISTSIP
jgi:putative NIF3 family GTP cyclohydrolase 1 type 2